MGNTNELTSGSATAYVLDEAKKVCVGSLLVGAASGPLQDNSVSDVPTAKQGGTQLCDGCANFTIPIPGTDQCQGCTAGFYYTEVNGIRCDVCDPGYYRNTEPTLGPEDDYNGSPYTDDEWDFWEWPVIDATSYRCHPCEPGTYQPNQQASSCVPCPAGKYGNTWMATECKDCPAGQFMNTVGHKALQTDAYVCSACVAGKYQDVVGESYCKDCSPGTYTNEIALSACKDCDAGRFLSVGRGIKAHCAPGETNTNALCCEDCAAGSYSPSDASTACTDCELGRTQSVIAQDHCDQCIPGRFMGIQGSSAAECNICTAGKFSQADASVCGDCAAGKYSAAEAGQCTDCEQGKYQSSAGQSSCTDCDAGKFLGQTGQTGTVTFLANSGATSNCAGPAMTYTWPYAGGGSPSGCYNHCAKYQDCRYFQVVTTNGNKYCYNYKGGCVSSGSYYKMNFIGACDDCAAGTYSNDGAASCTACSNGYFSGSGASACTICPVGKRTAFPGGWVASAYGDGMDLTTCYDCPGGTYQDQEGSTVNDPNWGCKACNGGQYSAAGSASCTNCDAGQYLYLPSGFSYGTADSCKNCAAGTYSSAGATLCTTFSSCHIGTGCSSNGEGCTGQTSRDYYCSNTDTCRFSDHGYGLVGAQVGSDILYAGDYYVTYQQTAAQSIQKYTNCYNYCFDTFSQAVYFQNLGFACYCYASGTSSGNGGSFTFKINNC